jgi:mannose-6-phosphate isomerase-like protein (cupin superfamily)
VRFSEGVEEPVPYDQPVIWIMLEGEAQVRVEDVNESTHFERGETVLLPARMKNPIIKTLKDCIWLEVTFPTTPEVG